MTEVEVFNLSDESRSFATRMRGKEIVRLVVTTLEETPQGVVAVNWERVNAASPSFIDEMVTGLQAFIDKDPSRSSIAFSGLGPGIAGTVDAVLSRRGFSVKHLLGTDTFDWNVAEVLGCQEIQPTGAV